MGKHHKTTAPINYNFLVESLCLNSVLIVVVVNVNVSSLLSSLSINNWAATSPISGACWLTVDKLGVILRDQRPSAKPIIESSCGIL